MIIHLIENSTIVVDDEITNLGDLSITQGLSYYLSFYIKSNYESWIPKSQIRTSYVDQGGIKEAEFNFKPNVYLPERNITFIRPYLKASETKELVSTTYQAKPNQTPNDTNCFLYSLVLINPLDEDDIYPMINTSFVQVKPGVTI